MESESLIGVLLAFAILALLVACVGVIFMLPQKIERVQKECALQRDMLVLLMAVGEGEERERVAATARAWVEGSVQRRGQGDEGDESLRRQVDLLMLELAQGPMRDA